VRTAPVGPGPTLLTTSRHRFWRAAPTLVFATQLAAVGCGSGDKKATTAIAVANKTACPSTGRTLDEDEIETVRTWVAGGALE
jgi:hypothetical protein